MHSAYILRTSEVLPSHMDMVLAYSAGKMTLADAALYLIVAIALYVSYAEFDSEIKN
ncbi:hypothetical protein D918_10092 [Trichuris suis]|nr:hypothetical protein D918_10092 [Trichuris suis]